MTVTETPLLPPYASATSPSVDTSFAQSPPPKPDTQSSLDSLIKEYVSKYDDIFQEQEKHRREVFTEDLKLYNEGFDQVDKDIQQSIWSRPALFQKTSKILHAIYSDDQERYAQVFADKTFLQDSKDTHRQSEFLTTQQRFILYFDRDQVSVLKHFTISDDGEWSHLSILQASIQNLFVVFEGSLQALAQKHATIFEAAMREYSRRLGLPVPPEYDQDDVHPAPGEPSTPAPQTELAPEMNLVRT